MLGRISEIRYRKSDIRDQGKNGGKAQTKATGAATAPMQSQTQEHSQE
jgi:hypothetical protein